MTEPVEAGLIHRKAIEAVTDERVRAIVSLALHRESAILTPREFKDLKVVLSEHGIFGSTLPRVVYMCASDIKRAEGLRRSVD